MASVTTVPLTDLYGHSRRMGNATDEYADYIRAMYGVTVVRDHANRHAVSIEDAYKIRDAIMKTEAELARTELEQAAKAGELRAWQRARNEFFASNLVRARRVTRPGGKGIERLNAAREILAKEVLAAEQAAGIPAEVARQLGWPPFDMVEHWPDKGEDTSYKAPFPVEAVQ